MTDEADALITSREPSRPPPALTPPQRWLSRYALPGAVLAGFSGLFAWSASDHWSSGKPVTVVPVVVKRTTGGERAGAPLFRAAGWIEPRPTPILVPSLAEGIISEVLVVQGQEIAEGEIVARLIDVNAKLEVERADADVELRRAELASAEADLSGAQRRYDQPVHLDSSLAEAESQLADVQTELAGAPLQIEAAAAEERFSAQDFEGKRLAGSAVSTRQIQQAEAAWLADKAKVEELNRRHECLRGQVDALRRRVSAISIQRSARVLEGEELAMAKAHCDAARAKLKQAELALKEARLRLERMEVRAPRKGRVLELVARPGAKVHGLSMFGGSDSSSILTMYDPAQLQVRADVRLEDVPLARTGQRVAIQTASTTQTMDGVVLFSTSYANVQKNTLEFKVAIESPPATLRPEMLVEVTFLAPEEAAATAERHAVFAPLALMEGDERQRFVWIVDADSVARRRSIQLGLAGDSVLVEVVSGLQATDRLIASGREGLTEGMTVRVTGEDPNFGESPVGKNKVKSSPNGRSS